MTPTQALELALPLLTGIMLSILQENHWPDLVNSLIMLAAAVAAGGVTAFFGGQLTGDPAADAGVILVATIALQELPTMQPLFDAIRSSVHPISKPPAPMPAPIPFPTPPPPKTA